MTAEYFDELKPEMQTEIKLYNWLTDNGWTVYFNRIDHIFD